MNSPDYQFDNRPVVDDTETERRAALGLDDGPTAASATLLDDLRGDAVTHKPVARYQVLGRPGWEVACDPKLISQTQWETLVTRHQQPGGGVSTVKLSCLVLITTCVGLWKGDVQAVTMEGKPVLFSTRAFRDLYPGVADGWNAVRHFYGAHNEEHITATAEAVLVAAGIGSKVDVGADTGG